MTRCPFVPPYLLKSLVDNVDDTDLADILSGTLQVDQLLRDRRAEIEPTAIPGEARRTVSDAHNTQNLPGEAVRSEDDPPTGDAAVDEAYDGMGAARALFREVYNRNSLDGQGHPLDATVHYGQNYANAFWDGRRLVFGDGDGRIFERFTKPLDVIAHEFTHGVTQFTPAALEYRGQAGSLNESVSDVFAALTTQRLLGQTADEASWLIGEGLFKPEINATALRSMKAPGTAYDDPRIGRDPQPGKMSDFVETTDDNGGVHINSGIPNRAFYLAASALGGNAWEVAGQIWYDTLTDERLQSDATFADFAELTIDNAAKRYGADSAERRAVADAWATVEVIGGAAPDERQPAPPVTAHVVTVRRSGGFAGMVTERQVDTAVSANGSRIESLLEEVDFTAVRHGSPQPDAYVFSIAIDDQQYTVFERDLPPRLAEVIGLVLEGNPDS